MSQNGELAYEFGEFRLDCRQGVLRRGKHVLHLPPKTFEILVVLVRNSPLIVSKSDLLRLAWPGIYVEESAVERQICDLRKVLAAADGARTAAGYIQTVWKKGYRMLPEVRMIAEPAPRPDRVWTRVWQAAAAFLPAILVRTVRADG